MKRLLIIFIMLCSCLSNGQELFVVGKPNEVLFTPTNYQKKDHLFESPIFIKDLINRGPTNRYWKIHPVFRTEQNQSIIEIETDGADLYGTGQVFGHLRRNGDKTLYWNLDNWSYKKYNGKMCYESMPWILGLRQNGKAFGFIFETTYRSSLECYDDKVVFKSDGPPFRVLMFDKENPEEVLKTLAEYTGKMELPPLWALGYHQCRYSYRPDKRVKEIANEFRKRNIPCDSIWLDIHYMDGYRLFTFDKNLFPNPFEMSEYLHTNNFKLITILDCGIKNDENYFAYKQLIDHSVLDKDKKTYIGRVWPGDCIFPDIVDPKCQEIWADLCSDFVKTNGIDGIWTDMNEPAIFGGPDMSMPKDNIHCINDKDRVGLHEKYHNIYGYSITKATKAGLLKANPNKRPFILTRSNFLGGQRFAAMWTGDNYACKEHLLGAIPMSLNISLSGQPFNGPDIGGFSGKTDGEMLATWMAMGVFFPFVRNHADNNTPQQEPWVYGEAIEKSCRTSINRRYALLPYIYTVFQEASQTGMPVMRPAFFMDIQNPELRSQEKVFLIGNDILVVPSFAKGEKLPIDGWKKIVFENEETDQYQSDLYLRPGAAIPMLSNKIQSSVDYDPSSLIILVNYNKDKQAKGRFYDDDRDGFGYKKGIYALYDIHVSNDSIKLNQIKGNKHFNERKLQLKLLK